MYVEKKKKNYPVVDKHENMTSVLHFGHVTLSMSCCDTGLWALDESSVLPAFQRP